MSLLKIKILKSWTRLAQFISRCFSLVRGSFQIIFLMVLESGWQKIVHYSDTNIDSTALGDEGERGGEGGREGEREREREREGERGGEGEGEREIER